MEMMLKKNNAAQKLYLRPVSTSARRPATTLVAGVLATDATPARRVQARNAYARGWLEKTWVSCAKIAGTHISPNDSRLAATDAMTATATGALF